MSNVAPKVTEDYHNTVKLLYSKCQVKTDKKFIELRLPWVVSLTPNAKDCWREFYNRHSIRTHECDRPDIQAAFCKIEAYAARLALVHHLVRYVNGEVSDPLHLDALPHATQCSDRPSDAVRPEYVSRFGVHVPLRVVSIRGRRNYWR